MIGSFDFTGTGREINASGAVFRYERGTSQGASTGLRVRADGQDLGIFEPGDSVRLPAPASRWELIPVSNSLAGFVRIGPASFETSRVTGQVAIAPSTYGLAMQHRAFVRNIVGNTPTGANQEFQLWNPANSGKALVITQAEACCSSYDITFLQIDNVQAPNPFGFAWSKRDGLRHDTVGASVETRGYTTPRMTAIGNGLVAMMTGFYGQAPHIKTFTEPVVVTPGRGLTAFLGSAGTVREWRCQVEFFEIPLSEL